MHDPQAAAVPASPSLPREGGRILARREDLLSAFLPGCGAGDGAASCGACGQTSPPRCLHPIFARLHISGVVFVIAGLNSIHSPPFAICRLNRPVALGEGEG